jgi:hypothetical protein
VAGDENQEARTLRLHSSWGQKVVEWTAKRDGQWPDLPTPEPTNSNEVLAEVEIIETAPPLDTDGETRIFEASGTYVYHLKKAPWYADGLAGATLPYTNIPREANALSSAQFVSGII